MNLSVGPSDPHGEFVAFVYALDGWKHVENLGLPSGKLP